MAIAKLECTCERCGRKFEHRRTVNNRRDANSYTAWANDHITVCPDCYHEAQKEAEARKIAEEAVKLNLPVLVGTEKQTAWAMKIRHDLLEEAKTYGYTASRVRKYIATGNEQHYLDTMRQNKDKHPHQVRLALAVYKAITEESAKWWIENR